MTLLLKLAGYLPPRLTQALVEVTLAYHMINAMAKADRAKRVTTFRA